MKLYIFDRTNGRIGDEKNWWFNFRKSNDPMAWPNEVLQKDYNAELVINSDEDTHILFKNESDATLFLLRFQ